MNDKTQWIRLADVFAIGPLMVWGGWKLRQAYPILGYTLATCGVGTIAYNGCNYLKKRG